MKVTIEYQNGATDVLEDVAPSVDLETQMFNCIDADYAVVVNGIPFKEIKQIIFDPND